MSQLQASVYSKHSNLQKEDGLRLISKLSLKEGMRILDLGCGTGYLSSVLARNVGPSGDVVGIDPDTARIDIARDTYAAVTNLSFQEGSTENIPEGRFDVVFSSYVFHWVEDKKAAFKNVFNCLNPKGTFALCSVTSLLPVLEDVINLLEPDRVKEVKAHLHHVSADKIGDIALSSGFTAQFREENISKVRYKFFDEYIQAVYGGFGGLVEPEHFDQEKLQQLKQRVGTENIEFEANAIVSFVFERVDDFI